MANKYYQPGSERAARVNDLFATIAPRYDLINDLQSAGLHRLWKRRLVNLAKVCPGQRILDVCCGTGDIAFDLRKAGGQVVGLDFSAPMLAVASNRRTLRAGTGDPDSQLHFVRGDAMHLPFADHMFDVVTVGYGLRNLSQWERGLGEMWRVAKPGGRLLILDFGRPQTRWWRDFYFAYLRVVVPVFGRLFCGDAQTHGYILTSLRNYPAQWGVDAELRRLGAMDPVIINFLGGAMSINLATKPS